MRMSADEQAIPVCERFDLAGSGLGGTARAV
jgi:hypothetical protein